ncbi:MAG: heme-binding protein, partial [Methylotenera sp.]
MHVSFEVAQQIIDKAVEKSKQIGVKMCIAVLDSGGN